MCGRKQLIIKGVLENQFGNYHVSRHWQIPETLQSHVYGPRSLGTLSFAEIIKSVLRVLKFLWRCNRGHPFSWCDTASLDFHWQSSRALNRWTRGPQVRSKRREPSAKRYIPEDWEAPKLDLLMVGSCIKILRNTFMISVGTFYPVYNGEFCLGKSQVYIYIYIYIYIYM